MGGQVPPSGKAREIRGLMKSPTGGIEAGDPLRLDPVSFDKLRMRLRQAQDEGVSSRPLVGGRATASAPDGVTLHAARIGAGLEHRAFRRLLCGAGGKPALRPILAQ